MSLPDTTGNGRGNVKTLAIRLEPDLHAQLSLIAQLRSSTITDEIRMAIEAHIATIKASPELAGKADDVLAAIEADAAARRDAISTLFGTTPAVEENPGYREQPRPRPKARQLTGVAVSTGRPQGHPAHPHPSRCTAWQRRRFETSSCLTARLCQ
ncbi:MAG: hypothetical protein QOH56_2710 [Pseudonocardiales bacterium]|nr:hypothetical protein [Pseudonocardiales bacterium]